MIYVDDYKGKFRNMIMCHMMADSLEELHEFAQKLGMKREWLQDGSAPHYDLSKERRALALKLGATEVPIYVNDRPNPEWKRVYAMAKKLKES